jgi:NAD(P)H dehydrogenase (quinone)
MCSTQGRDLVKIAVLQNLIPDLLFTLKEEENMIAITGITGRIGGRLAGHLTAQGIAVRGVVRDPKKGETWKRQGCETAVAQPTDEKALTAAFRGAEAVFILPPPIFDPHPGFAEVYTAMTAHRNAARNAGVGKVLYLSTVGAQARQTNLLSQHTVGESIFSELDAPVTYLRPAWFLENISWDIDSARDTGVLHSFLSPLNKPVPMVAVDDISRVAAELIQEQWDGHRVVELEGPKRITAMDIADALGKALRRPVEAQAVPRESWEGLFTSQGMVNPYPRIRMLDGFNEGWIDFEGGIEGSRKGETNAETVIGKLIDSHA